eukprot:6788-Alexandrium_andersonii.AAC.1
MPKLLPGSKALGRAVRHPGEAETAASSSLGFPPDQTSGMGLCMSGGASVGSGTDTRVNEAEVEGSPMEQSSPLHGLESANGWRPPQLQHP